MVENHSQPASVGSASEIERGLATQSVTILGFQFNVQSPYSAGHVCTKGEATALNQKRLESIRNNLAVRAKDGALTQADVDAYAVSFVFGEIGSPSALTSITSASSIMRTRHVCRRKFRGAFPATHLRLPPG
jgi:hypothetical protein